MFEKASRLKLRFQLVCGLVAADDLWDLPLKTTKREDSLNTLAMGLDRQLKTTTVSFVDDDAQPDELLQLRFDIVKHVIAVKKGEAKAAAEARERADKKQKILGILARKQDATLEAASEDDLRKLLADL